MRLCAVALEPVDPQLQLSLASPEGLVERFLVRQKTSTRQAYAQDLADFARFLGAESSQAAAGPNASDESSQREHLSD